MSEVDQYDFKLGKLQLIVHGFDSHKSVLGGVVLLRTIP